MGCLFRLIPLLVAVCFAGMAQSPKATPVGALQLAHPVISQIEDGSAMTGGDKVVAGEMVFFRFDALGFKTAENGKVQLTGRVQVLDSRGTPIAPPDEIVIATSLRDEDKEWQPRLRTQFQIPSIAPPGVYRVRFDATDEQTHAKASGESSFSVSGSDVPASAALVIRGMGFYRTPDDAAPLKTPAYRGGDMVWIRFDVTGFKYGEQNAIDVAYDVEVATAAGKQLFTQENAAAEKSQAFYPQPWVPGSFSLTLQTNTTLGIYTVSVTARDAIGNQTATEKAQFKVE